MLGKDIYDSIHKDLKQLLNKSDDEINLIASTMPASDYKLFALSGYGMATVRKEGPAIFEAVENIKEKYNITYLKREESLKLYENYVWKLKKLNLIDALTSGEFADKFNHATKDFGVPFRMNSKTILVFALNQKIIKYLSNGVFELDERGKRNGFIVEQKAGTSGKNFSVLILTKQSCKYLMALLDYIFYYFYGFNPINYYILNSQKDFSISIAQSKKFLLIFDLDATVFDTDKYRIKRQRYGVNSITRDELDSIELIEGFNETFLYSNSELNIFKNKVLFITNSPENYAKKLLNKCIPNLKLLNFRLYTSSGNNRINMIVNFINENNMLDYDVIAFGDDEKDALTYSICNVPYYLVNNYYGYGSINEILNNRIIPNKLDFRCKFMYDILSINEGYRANFYSKYFDDMVIYYRRYYDKTDNHGRCPTIEGREQLPKLKYHGFADCTGMKSIYVKNNIDSFINNEFKNFLVTKETLFAKVPGHNEISSDLNNPVRYILNSLGIIYGVEKNKHDLLLRSKSVSVLHGMSGGDRNIQNHLDSIYVNNNYKIKGKIIYLFDDIVTTGASMMACVEKLYEAGAGHVVCFCLGRSCPVYGYSLKMLEGRRRY